MQNWFIKIMIAIQSLNCKHSSSMAEIKDNYSTRVHSCLEPSVRASLVFIFHRAVEKLMTDYKYFRLSVGHKKLIILTFLSMAEWATF